MTDTTLPPHLRIRPIDTGDDAAMAAIIRTVMPEFGALGSGFAPIDHAMGATRQGGCDTCYLREL